MIDALVPVLLPLALTTSPNPATPPSYHQVRAYVTGYNTVPAQTDSTPCIAASGADICGRRDAVACPTRIGLGTVVEIRGTTYVCEDRLARKYNTRFDISCDKDVECPPEVTGWATINVYGDLAPSAAVHHAAAHGNERRWWVRPRSAASWLWRAATRTASSGVVTILRGAVVSREARPPLRHAANSRAPAWRVSRG